jgi:hypothetical protein
MAAAEAKVGYLIQIFGDVWKQLPCEHDYLWQLVLD